MSRPQAIKQSVWMARLGAAAACPTESVCCCPGCWLLAWNAGHSRGKNASRSVFKRGLHQEVISALDKNCVSKACEAALYNF